MILSEARGLQLFSVIRGGIGLTRRLGAGLQHTECLNERMDTLPRTRASQEPIGYHRGMKTLGDHLGSIRCLPDGFPGVWSAIRKRFARSLLT